MHFHLDALILISLGTLISLGCGTKPQDAAPATAADPAHADAASPVAVVERSGNAGKPTTSAPAATPPKAPAPPTAEQIARWDVPEYQPLELLACRDGFRDPAVFSMALSPDGNQYVLGGAKITLWNVPDAEPIASLLDAYEAEDVERPIEAVAISADGQWIAAGDQKGRLFIWTRADQREVAKFKAHDAHITQLAFSPDSRLLATTSYSGEVNFWQLPDGNKLKSLKIDEQQIHGLAFLSDKQIAAAGSSTTIWNFESGTKEATLTTKYVTGPALGLSADRRLLAFNDADGLVQFWDVQKSQLTGAVLRRAAAHLIVFSDDGKQIATYSQDSNIRIWDTARGTVTQVIDADGGRTSALAWLPGSGALMIASELGRIRIWGTPQMAQTLAIEPIKLPTLATTPADAHRSMSSAELQRIMDVRSFPQLPGAVPQFGEFGMCSYSVDALQAEAEQFYRYYLAKAGWTEGTPTPATQPGLVFHKDQCALNVFFAPGTAGAGEKKLQITLQFSGNYDARWLPKIAAIDSKGTWDSLSAVSYRTKANLTDCEVALLKQYHDAGWTAYTRLSASGLEEPTARRMSMLQGGSVLTVSIGYPADSSEELVVQSSVTVTDKSLPIPPDAGWIEFDSSTDIQLVINTKMDQQQTVDFYDKQMAASGWLARETGRQFKDDKAWLPYIRGQQDIFLRLTALPQGGTRIIAGNTAHSSSWQLQSPPKETEKPAKPGVEAADFALPDGAASVKFDVDQKQIEFAAPDMTPQKVGEKFVALMESLGWTRDGAGIVSDEYVFITYTKEKAEIQLRARSGAPSTTAMISGDGLLWDKPLPTAPARISYETWLRRNRYDATLDRLDEFSAAMNKIPAAGQQP